MSSAVALQSGGTVATVVAVAGVVLFVLPVVGMWKMFEKAGKPGWAALIPVYNLWVLVDVADKEWWWFLVLFIPSANLAAWVIVNVGVADQFGQRAAFGVALSVLFFLLYPVVGFGDYEYEGDPDLDPA